MPLSRYSYSPILALGRQYGTQTVVERIRQAVRSGELPVTTITSRGLERLDTIAGSIYGDSRYWWIIAACSDVGCGLQVPPGTMIKYPDIDDVVALMG